MKKSAVLIAVTLVFIPVCAYAVLLGKNLIQNGSFDNPPGHKNEVPRGWCSWNSDYNGISTDEFRKGQQSIYLSCPKQNDVNGIFFPYYKVTPGKKYSFSCYAKNSSDDPIKGNAFGEISIEWEKKGKGKDKDGKIITIYSEISREWGPTFGPDLPAIRWIQFSMTGTAPVDADTCYFVIQFFNKGNGSGKFFVDDAEAGELGTSAAVNRSALPSKEKR